MHFRHNALFYYSFWFIHAVLLLLLYSNGHIYSINISALFIQSYYNSLIHIFIYIAFYFIIHSVMNPFLNVLIVSNLHQQKIYLEVLAWIKCSDILCGHLVQKRLVKTEKSIWTEKGSKSP